MSDIKVLEGPDFLMTNIISDELLEKVFDISNCWMQDAIEELNKNGRRVVNVQLSFKPNREGHVPDNVVNLNIAIHTR